MAKLNEFSESGNFCAGMALNPSGLIPVIIFSVGIPSIEPCTKYLCCLWDVAERYKDHNLQTALGPTCN